MMQTTFSPNKSPQTQLQTRHCLFFISACISVLCFTLLSNSYSPFPLYKKSWKIILTSLLGLSLSITLFSTLRILSLSGKKKIQKNTNKAERDDFKQSLPSPCPQTKKERLRFIEKYLKAETQRQMEGKISEGTFVYVFKLTLAPFLIPSALKVARLYAKTRKKAHTKHEKAKDLKETNRSLQREVRILKKIHQRITTYGEGQALAIIPYPRETYTLSDGRYAYITELYTCDLFDLASLSNEKQPTFLEKLKMFDSLFSTLLWMHKYTIFHGDIKPENIFFSQEKKAYFGDFGGSSVIPFEEIKKISEISATKQGNREKTLLEYWKKKRIRQFTLEYLAPSSLTFIEEKLNVKIVKRKPNIKMVKEKLNIKTVAEYQNLYAQRDYYAFAITMKEFFGKEITENFRKTLKRLKKTKDLEKANALYTSFCSA